MLFLSALGTSMIATSVIGMVLNTPTAHLRRSIRKYLQATKTAAKIKEVRRKGNIFSAKLALAYGLTADKFSDHVSGLEQATSSTIKFRHLYGSMCELKFGYEPFHEKMQYTTDLPLKPLAIPLHTPFGLKMLDFNDESCCHLLVGGATRMGKSVFLRLIATHLIRSTGGNVEIIFIDNKINDLHMFRGVRQVTTAETQAEAVALLDDILVRANERKERLKELGDVIDAKDFRSKYPDSDEMTPIFIIIDEYGRFADSVVIQDIVKEIAETAGYLDVHLVIASQRPDAKDVLKPRIKANILTRVSFKTFDETNSRIILDLPDAAHIEKIQGRAVLVDGFPEVVQVPYISAEQVKELLASEIVEAGSENTEDAEALPGFVTGSTSGFGVS